MSKKITKVSFKAAGEGGVKISYENYDTTGLKDETNKNSKHVPHETFKAAMQRLKGHMLLISEMIPTAPVKKYEKLELTEQQQQDYRVCGFTVSGDGDKEGIIITGYKTLSNGLGFVFNTPNTRVENEGESAYPHISELLADIELVKDEAEQYLRGKYGVQQGELFPEREPAEQD